MKTVIPYKTTQITRQEILDNIKANNGDCYFHIAQDWEYLSVEILNELLDDAVYNGHYLMDISYDPVGIDSGEIIFEVCASDVSEYLNEENYDPLEEPC